MSTSCKMTTDLVFLFIASSGEKKPKHAKSINFLSISGSVRKCWEFFFVMGIHFFVIRRITQQFNSKGEFLSEDTDAFVITSNRRTFFFPETENLDFVDF